MPLKKIFLAALKSMPNNKTPGNDGLSEEVYETSLDNAKVFFHNSLKESKEIGSLSILQRQAIMKLLEKKERLKVY